MAKETAKVEFAVIDPFPWLLSVPHRELQVSAEDSAHPDALGRWLGVLAWNRSAVHAVARGETL